jgi:ubiquinone/menaquinone biosynthesis C-methylase UbiE
MVEKLAIPSPGQQKQVDAYFQSQSFYWEDIYASKDVYAQIHQERHAMALTWIDDLPLAPGTTRVLEIGCVAGLMSLELAMRGFRVQAIDSTEAMLEQASKHAHEAGVTDLLSLSSGDACNLAFAEDTFDLVIALGVLPWLGQPELAIREMARVTKPGGYALFTADNRLRLNALLDPWLNPALVPLKRWVKTALDRAGLRHWSMKDVGATFHSRRFIDQTLMRAGLEKTRDKTLGFGPFTIFRQPIVPDAVGIKLHRRLQALADRETPGLRTTGAHYLVLTSKPRLLQVLPIEAIRAGKSDSHSASHTTTALLPGNGGFSDEGHE